jgi:hypothetical protein
MTKLNWQTVGLIAVLSAVAVALAAWTDWSPAEILGLLGLLAGIGGGAVITGAVSGRVEQMQQDTAAQTTTLSAQTTTLAAQSSTLRTIADRVNGELDGRIAAGAEQAAAKVLAVLREQGVIQ